MPEALPLQPGDPRRLGAYGITGRLGVGEQGAVFLGADPAGRTVAVKLLHVRLSGEPAARGRFTAAFEAARRISGFCTAAVLDADVQDDRAYVVSECVDGPSLQQLVDEEGPRGAAVVERLAVGLAVALAAVHRAGAVHHDLKPANVLLGRDGPKMCDIGVHGALDAVLGDTRWDPDASDPSHLLYRAPEQLSGLRADPPADVFAWASTLLFAATGAPPFGDGSPSETVQQIMYDDPDLSAAPDALREVLAAALAKDPAARPTAKGLLERLLDEGGPLAARMPASLVAEGRALAAGAVPAPKPPPPAQAPAPQPPAPQPQGVPQPPPPAAPAGTPMGAPPAPRALAPLQGPQGQAVPPPVAPPPPAEATRPEQTPGKTLLGKLARGRDRPEPPPPPAVELDPGAFEATTTFGAVADDRTTTMGAVTDDRTAVIGALPAGDGETRTFDAVPETRDPTAPHLIPGLRAVDDDEPPRRPPSFPSLRGMRRPGNHVLGVALSLLIGVGVGIAIIALVLWPQLKGDDTAEPPAGAGDTRPVSVVPKSFAGTWTGTMVNNNSQASFPLEVTFEEGATTARVVYPKEKCNGTLTFESGTNSSLKLALEVPRPCTPGAVEATLQPDGTIRYAWTRPGTNLGYQGALSRR
ncbi:serine/threonine protein kinase [Actinomadura rifamycini]|uniref:serine/threonine protein kinase n=1 Tax=Actinomadura rifamycini TaxID=31962 RepID=UPI00041BE51B|nr:serine/threonine-protein kinase [Actinomadura rifamycini]